MLYTYFGQRISQINYQNYTDKNYVLSSVRVGNIHLRAFSQEIPGPSINKISLKISFIYPRAKLFNSLSLSGAFICVSKFTIIGSDNGLTPIRRQAIT